MPCRRSSPRTRTSLRHRRRDPSGPRRARGRELSGCAGRPGQEAQDDQPRPIRGQVRPSGRDDPLAAGRGRLRHAVPESRPDGLGLAVLRDGRRPGRSSRRRTPTPPSSSPTAAGSWSRRRRPSCSPPRSTRSSRTRNCAAALGRKKPTSTAARWCGPTSGRNTGPLFARVGAASLGRRSRRQPLGLLGTQRLS